MTTTGLPKIPCLEVGQEGVFGLNFYSARGRLQVVFHGDPRTEKEAAYRLKEVESLENLGSIPKEFKLK